MVFTDPRWDWVAVADLPVETLLCLVDSSSYTRVDIGDDFPHIIHISWLEPGLFDVFNILVGEDPVDVSNLTRIWQLRVPTS